MKRYIALLRAINLGGHTVTMKDLRALFEELGFTNVRSYIQTGNIFFETSATDRLTLQNMIEAHLSKNLRYDVPTFLRTIEEVEVALATNPFQERELTPETRFLVVFVSPELPPDFKPFSSPKGEYEVIGFTKTEVFVVMHLVNGRPGNPILLEKLIHVRATSRFYHTTVKILAAAKL